MHLCVKHINKKQRSILYLKQYNSICIFYFNTYTLRGPGRGPWTSSILSVPQNPMFSMAPSPDISCSLLYLMLLLPVDPTDYVFPLPFHCCVLAPKVGGYVLLNHGICPPENHLGCSLTFSILSVPQTQSWGHS